MVMIFCAIDFFFVLLQFLYIVCQSYSFNLCSNLLSVLQPLLFLGEYKVGIMIDNWYLNYVVFVGDNLALFIGAKIFEFKDFIVCNTRLPISLTFVDIFPHRQLTFTIYRSLNKSYTNNGVHICDDLLF